MFKITFELQPMASAIKIEDWEKSTKKNYYYNAATQQISNRTIKVCQKNYENENYENLIEIEGIEVLKTSAFELLDSGTKLTKIYAFSIKSKESRKKEMTPSA